MKKIIKRYGHSNIIILNSDDMKIYGLKIGDVVEIHLRKDNIQENSESTGDKCADPDDAEFSSLSKKTDENISEICKQQNETI